MGGGAAFDLPLVLEPNGNTTQVNPQVMLVGEAFPVLSRWVGVGVEKCLQVSNLLVGEFLTCPPSAARAWGDRSLRHLTITWDSWRL
jgi:hypothetical protein